MNNKKFIEERLEKAEKLLSECNSSLEKYNAIIEKRGERKEMKDTIGKPIYDRRKKTLDEDKKLKTTMSEKLVSCSQQDIDEIVEELKTHKIKDNEEFVDDFVKLLKEYEKDNEFARLSSEIVLELFAHYVVDQQSLSQFNVDFYKAVLDRINELDIESNPENE